MLFTKGVLYPLALIYALDRDSAAIAVVDSNLHRENILPSEKAFAYKMKMEAMKHQTNQDILTEQKHAEEELQKSIIRNEQVAQLYEKLYEDNASERS